MAPSTTPSRTFTARGGWVRLLTSCGLAALIGSIFCATGRSAADPDDVTIDRTLPMFLHIEDEQPILSARQNGDEAEAYHYLLTLAHRASTAAFARKTRTDVHHYNLWAPDRQKYRGEIVHVEGKLRQLWRFDAPKLDQNAGVHDLYEAWILDDRDRYNPWCLIFTDLPPGLNVDGPYGQHVAFDGYFFKLYRYKDRKDETRLAPLLIGHAPVVDAVPAESDDLGRYFTTHVIAGLLGLISLTVVGILLLAWRFRRGDERVRQRLAAARAGAEIESLEKDA